MVFINRVLVPFLCAGKRVLVFCMGGHGRTGTVLAALKAMLEPDTEDPIADVREAYCQKAVETDLQAEAVFALRGQHVPEKYEGKLIRVHR